MLQFFILQYYQALFRDGECFLHIVSLLNGNVDEANGEKLVLNVLQTLTCLLAKNEVSKVLLKFVCGRLIYLLIFWHVRKYVIVLNDNDNVIHCTPYKLYYLLHVSHKLYIYLDWSC